jgi:hypothetical protein
MESARDVNYVLQGRDNILGLDAGRYTRTAASTSTRGHGPTSDG